MVFRASSRLTLLRSIRRDRLRFLGNKIVLLVFDFFKCVEDRSFTILNNLSMSSQVFSTFFLECKFLVVNDANGRHIVTTDALLARLHADNFFLEKRAIKYCCLILTALATDIETKLLRKLTELGL